ncbi:MAG: disulfide bond formation protein DsbA [Candidatus Kaiserbacteria bacterium]|nr:disulfide bond formation protein DsbA [Candidatus Kaiserbacteria bacterium]
MEPTTQTNQIITHQKNRAAFAIPLAIIIAGLFVGVGLFFGLRGAGNAQLAQNGAQQQAAGATNTTKDQIQAAISPVESAYLDTSLTGKYPITLGHADAPVTMDYWYDYQCPYCKAVDVGHPQIPIKPSMAMIVKDYVDTGKVKLVFKSFPFLGQDSITAAEYAHAIWMLYPDKFYEWHTHMMQAQDAEGDTGFGNAATIDILIGLIPGLDDNKIKQYIADNKAALDKQITAEQKDGSDHGVAGTPGFEIGSQSLDGAHAPEDFISAIDSQLK